MDVLVEISSEVLWLSYVNNNIVVCNAVFE